MKIFVDRSLRSTITMSTLPYQLRHTNPSPDHTLVKAFLSHTSSDKEFVEAVAKQLGRIACIFDKWCFHHGDEFVRVIEEKLDLSELFVLFASRRSLRADWVHFEVELASVRRVGHKTRIIVIALEPNILIQDYPEWMRASKIVFAPSAELAAREIRSHVNMLVASRMPSTFVGRSRELSDCEKALAPVVDTTTSEPPRVLVLHGLAGIGRRTICSRVAQDMLQLRRVLTIGFSSADSPADLAFRLKADLEPKRSPQMVQQLREEIMSLSESDAITRILDAFRTMLEHGELPVLIDEGGVVAESGEYSANADTILRRVAEDRELYVAVISLRKTPERLSNYAPTPTVLVRPLETTDVQRLLGLLLRSSKYQPSPSQIKLIAERVKGHPPSAYYAARLVQLYGPDLVERKASFLEDFQASTFMRYLKENEALSLSHKRTLRLLSVYSPLPVDVVQRALDLTLEETTQVLLDLLDLSLVLVHESGLYGLAGPIEVAVKRIFGDCPVDHSKVTSALQEHLDKVDDSERHIILCQLAFQASAYADTSPPQWAIQLPRDLLDVARRSYHDQEYERTVKYAKVVMEQRPNESEAHRFLVRGLIQLEQFKEASQELQFFKKRGLLRDYHFLSGFSERRQGNPRRAIDSYNKAKQVGYSGVALERELAMCYFLVGSVTEAREHIANARVNDPDNRYLIDLELKIALGGRDVRTAASLIERLEIVDTPAYVKFRKSMLEYARGQNDRAVEYAEQSVEESTHGKPTFEMLANFAKCLIATEKFERAAGILNRIDRNFSKRRHDVRNGLWCKWHIAQHLWDEADGCWAKLKDRSQPVHLGLRRKIIDGFLSQSNLSSIQRDSFEKERRDIENQLTGIGNDRLWLMELMEYLNED